MTMPDICDSNGARPLKTPQDGAAPGSEPQRSPPSTTGGPSRPPCHARRRQRKATGSRTALAKKNEPFTVMHWNAEGVMNKKTELEHILHEKNINICCIQETHLKSGKAFKIRGYQSRFRSDRADRTKGGILTLVRNNIDACETAVHMENAEYQMIRAKLNDTELHILNFYCPNDRSLSLDTINVPNSSFLAIGDYNSHSQSWGYSQMDHRGEEVEDWQDEHKLILINSPSDTPTFYSRRWRTTSTPDLAFCTEDIHGDVTREVGEQLGGSDHRPVFLALSKTTASNPVLPRWNYKKAK